VGEQELKFNCDNLRMFTLGLSMKLRPDAYEEYKLAHDQLWPELAAGMAASQVSMATQRLRQDEAFALKVGVCSRCRAERTVIKAA